MNSLNVKGLKKTIIKIKYKKKIKNNFGLRVFLKEKYSNTNNGNEKNKNIDISPRVMLDVAGFKKIWLIMINIWLTELHLKNIQLIHTN